MQIFLSSSATISLSRTVFHALTVSTSLAALSSYRLTIRWQSSSRIHRSAVLKVIYQSELLLGQSLVIKGYNITTPINSVDKGSGI
jgi:hypothetical protein